MKWSSVLYVDCGCGYMAFPLLSKPHIQILWILKYISCYNIPNDDLSLFPWQLTTFHYFLGNILVKYSLCFMKLEVVWFIVGTVSSVSPPPPHYWCQLSRCISQRLQGSGPLYRCQDLNIASISLLNPNH